MTNTVSLVEPSARLQAVPVWQRVLDLLREECNDYFGLTILDAADYEGFFGGYVQIAVPDELRENWIRAHYGDILNKALAQVLGSEYVGYRIRIVEPEKQALTPKAAPVFPVVPRVVQKPQLKKVIRRKLSLYAGYTFENFVEGDCNFTACEACKSVAENPGDPALNPLFVYGKSGLGKTHLLQAVAAQIQKSRAHTRIVYCHAYDFLRDATAMSKALKYKIGNVRELAVAFQEKYENCDILLLDDVQLLECGVGTQERLAILIKHLRAAGKQVVLSCDRHPSQFNRLAEGEKKPAGHSSIPSISAKLLAPLESCVAVGIDEPDLSTRMKLIQKKSMNIPFVDKDREEICRFLSIPRRENVRVIEGMLNGLSAMNQFCQENLDLCAVKRLVAPSSANGMQELTIKGIAEVVALEFGTDMVALASKRQDAGVSLPRKVAMYLCREMTTDSHEKIGMLFNRDYSSVIAAVRSLIKQMDKDEALVRKVQDIRYLLEA